MAFVDLLELKKELAFLTESQQQYNAFLTHLSSVGEAAIAESKSKGKGKDKDKEAAAAAAAASSGIEIARLDAEMSQLHERLHAAKTRRTAAQARRIKLAKKIHEARLLRDEINAKVNWLTVQYHGTQDELKSCQEDALYTSVQLEKFMEISVINDAFYIWYSGPFATINNFRLGNSTTGRPVEWTEINAALGQAMLVVSIIATRAGVRFKQYQLLPMGSFSKVAKADDRRVVHNLFMDPTLFSLFPKSKFHPAMFGFLACVKELGDHISRHDPPLAMPYRIDIEEGKSPKIGTGREQLELFMGSDDVLWTRALKYLLSDIKWMQAWNTKHAIREADRVVRLQPPPE